MIPGPNHPKKIGPQVALFTIVPLVFFIYCVQSVHAAICPWEVASPYTQIDHPYEKHPAFKNQQYAFANIQGQTKKQPARVLMSKTQLRKAQAIADAKRRRLQIQNNVLSRKYTSKYASACTGYLKNSKALSHRPSTGSVCRSSAPLRFKPFSAKK